MSDEELTLAARELERGLADDLGGGVYKKRLSGNRYRAIVVAKLDETLVFEYIFSKQNRANIDDAELRAFRRLAKIYAALSREGFDRLVRNGDLEELRDVH